jgi:hypothetical protein
MLERIYTGRRVPEGMGGVSADQSSMPQPKSRVQELRKPVDGIISVMKRSRYNPRLFIPIP